MSDSKKRKDRPVGDGGSKGLKRSKGGTGGKWQTPHQQVKAALRGTGRLEPGDVGIWATCARRMEARATEELKILFEDCAEKFYGLKSQPDEIGEDETSIDDIESSIQREIASANNREGKVNLFTPVNLDIECVIFFKTGSPIDPVDFVHRICRETVSQTGIMRMRYVNRLTPVSMTAKASEKGLEEVGRSVIGKYFQLSDEGLLQEQEKGNSSSLPGLYSYAIRPTIRNHTALKRDAVIKQVAQMVGDKHKVDLSSPDKVILVEIYQTVCGMSVVDSDWEALKRFNLAELYRPPPKPPLDEAQASPQSVLTDEDTNPDSQV